MKRSDAEKLTDEDLWLAAARILNNDHTLVLKKETPTEHGFVSMGACTPAGKHIRWRDDCDYVACDEGGIFTVWCDIINEIAVPFRIEFYTSQGRKWCRLSWEDRPGSGTWSKRDMQPNELAREITRMFVLTRMHEEAHDA